MTLVCDAIARELRRRGVEHVFGIVGSGNFGVASAIEAAGMSFCSARHEEAALCMSDAYARSTGGVGVSSVHQGPGLTNSLTSLAEAAKGGSPLLVLAAETAPHDLRSNSRIDQGAVVRALGASVEHLRSPASAAVDVVRALQRAAVERGVVVLMVPVDLERARCSDEEPVPEGAPHLRPPGPSGEAIEEVVALIAAADRPAIVAGRGAVIANARNPIACLGERIGAILATSAQAHGLFAGLPFDIGISGGFSTPLAAQLLAGADLVLAFGAGLTDWTTRRGALIADGARIVQVDIDRTAIGRHRRVDVGVIGDAAETARAIVARLGDPPKTQSVGCRDRALTERLAAYRWRDEPYEDIGTGEHIDPRTLTAMLDGLLPAERVVVPDSGQFMGYPMMYMAVPDARGCVFTQDFMAIGLGLPTALGAAIAQPERVVVAALGDAGALMALGELETLARLKRRVVVVIYNDAGYGAEIQRFAPQGWDVDLVRFPDADFAAVGRALGIESATVRTPSDLDDIESTLRDPSGPVLIDAKIDRDLRGRPWMDEIPQTPGRWVNGACTGG